MMTFFTAVAALLLLLVLALAILVVRDRRDRRVLAPIRPAKAAMLYEQGEPPSRSTSARLADLETDVAALRQRLSAHEDSTGTRFRELHGRMAHAKRGGGSEAAAPQLPDVEPEGVRPLTPELLAQLGGAQPVAADQANALPALPPRPRRTWSR